MRYLYKPLLQVGVCFISAFYRKQHNDLEVEEHGPSLFCAAVPQTKMSFLVKFIRRQFFYKPPVPTASFEGKTVIVTGSNVGLVRLVAAFS